MSKKNIKYEKRPLVVGGLLPVGNKGTKAFLIEKYIKSEKRSAHVYVTS